MRNSPEAVIHRAFKQHLELRARPGLLFFHVPNEGRRSLQYGAELKRQGLLAGVADWILLYQGRFHALEVKASSRSRPTPEQRVFLAAVKDAGGQAAVAYGLDECLEVANGWGLLR
jgi:hypothetical protein